MPGAIFTRIRHAYADSAKLIERLNYIRNPLATDESMIDGVYVSLRHPFEEMMLIKNSYLSPCNNTLLGNHFFEYVVSLPVEESERVKDFVLCVQDINRFLATYSGWYFQTISAVHTNTDNLHAHIICNNIDFMTGARFNPPQHITNAIKGGVSELLVRHGFSSVLFVSVD